MGNVIDVFISHSVVDEEIANSIVTLIEHGLGLKHKRIFCSSIPSLSIPSGVGFIPYIGSRISEAKIFIGVVTEDFLRSRFCLAELGAAWGMKIKIIPLVVPPTKADDVKGILLGIQTFSIDSKKILTSVYDEIKEALNITDAEKGSWEMAEGNFLKSVEICIDNRKSKAFEFGINPAIESRVLVGAKEVYDDAIRMIRGARHSIKTTAIYKQRPIQKDIKNRYLSAIADSLNRGSSDEVPIAFKGVAQKENTKLVEERIRFFRRRGVLDYVDYRLTTSYLDIGFLIVDDENMHISFPFFSTDMMHLTLSFNNQAKFVGLLSDWFDKFLWENGAKVVKERPNRKKVNTKLEHNG